MDKRIQEIRRMLARGPSRTERLFEPTPQRPDRHQMNMSERYLLSVLKRVAPGEWEYTGDGTLAVGRLKPDYIYVNGRKAVIELYGNVWHTVAEAKERVARFKTMGYDCLIVWGEQLVGDECELIRHILEWKHYEPTGKDVGKNVPKPISAAELKSRIPPWRTVQT